MLFLLKHIRECFGYDMYSAETVDRLVESKHIQDLRWIVHAIEVLVCIIVVVMVLILFSVLPKSTFAEEKLHDWFVPIGAVLTVIGGIIAWCYRAGSRRLGVVDLFACEITTLCRICTLMGIVESCVRAFERDTNLDQPSADNKITELRAHFSRLVLSADYTPVFDANAVELQTLSVKVLTNITAFYTYWKGMRDAFRMLAITPVPIAVAPQDAHHESWHQAMANVIYMQFLVLESARKAIRDLIEFEPNRAENTITVLLSELPAYRFMLNYFSANDFRRSRLEQRREWYPEIVASVYYRTEDAYDKCNDPKPVKKQFRRTRSEDHEQLRRDWGKAHRLLGELMTRYKEAMGEFPGRDMLSGSQRPSPL